MNGPKKNRDNLMRCTHLFVVKKLQLFRHIVFAIKIRIILQVHHWHQDGWQWAFLVDCNPVFSLPVMQAATCTPVSRGTCQIMTQPGWGWIFKGCCGLTTRSTLLRGMSCQFNHTFTLHTTPQPHTFQKIQDATSTGNSRPPFWYTLLLFLQTPAAIRPTH